MLRSWRAGVRRQMVQLMLPLRQARYCCFRPVGGCCLHTMRQETQSERVRLGETAEALLTSGDWLRLGLDACACLPMSTAARSCASDCVHIKWVVDGRGSSGGQQVALTHFEADSAFNPSPTGDDSRWRRGVARRHPAAVPGGTADGGGAAAAAQAGAQPGGERPLMLPVRGYEPAVLHLVAATWFS